MKNLLKILSISVILSVVVMACNSSGSKDDGTATQPGIHMVKVVEVIPTSVYSYVKVNEKDAEYWIAIPNTKLDVGKTYYFQNAHVMKDFESKELGRTFETLYLVQALSNTPTDMPEVPEGHATGKRPAQKQTTETIKHAKDETSIADIYANPAAFAGKQIKVRGKVVRYNPRIMGKNWVHIQDGTEANGKFDLTITTQDEAKEGEVATFEGTIYLDKDFGAGYTYDVIMEGAKKISSAKL